MPEEVNEYLVTFANAIREKFSSVLVGQPEDELKNPVENLVRSLGTQFGRTLNVVTEAIAEDIGRPDMAIAVDGALAGNIELKKPGTGADPARFTGHNAQQWQKFQELPNLIYTDGNAWALYRSGQRVGDIVNIGNIDQRGVRGLSQEATPDFLTAIREFLTWEPVTPASPRALAELALFQEAGEIERRQS
jgi:ketosteroid isomerase-like protein